MTQYQLRGQGQIRAGGGATPLDGTSWHDVLVFTTTVSAALPPDSLPFGYGQQRRFSYQHTGIALPAPDGTHPELTIPKGAHLVVNAGLGYVNSDAGVILGASDGIQFARMRLVTGTGVRTPITGFEEIMPDAALSAHFGIDPALIEPTTGALPPKACVPVLGTTYNADGNYAVSFSRRFAVRIAEDIVIPANSGFAVQMRTLVLNRGFEYDALASVILS